MAIQRADEIYRVPQRFGMGPILATMLMLAFTFAVLKVFEAPPWLYLSLSLFFFTVCGAQMWVKRDPRIVSVSAGAIFLPIWSLLSAAVGSSERSAIAWTFASSPILALLGAFFGYVLGTLGAGVFLVLDQIRKKRKRKSRVDDDEFRMDNTSAEGGAGAPGRSAAPGGLDYAPPVELLAPDEETGRRETDRGEMGRGEMGRGEMGRGEMGRGEMGRSS